MTASAAAAEPPGATPVIVIAGPTASGKSDLALAAAEHADGTIINADSMQLYRELRVISARPGADAVARVPHRLYGVIPAADRCSAGNWRRLAVAEIAAAHAAGRTPIVVGGTGLYLRALIVGLSPIPAVPAAARQEATALLERLGGPAFHAALEARDPVMAARLAPGDSQRLVRAWEVLEATGRSLADWQRGPADGDGSDMRFLTLVLRPPREVLYRACDERFDRMLASGAAEEARAIAELGLAADLPAMKAVGLRPLISHLEGALSLAEARRLAQRDTRRYAKRQLTWFRHQMSPDHAFDEKFSESMKPLIFAFISNFLLTGSG